MCQNKTQESKTLRIFKVERYVEEMDAFERIKAKKESWKNMDSFDYVKLFIKLKLTQRGFDRIEKWKPIMGRERSRSGG